MVHPTSIVHGLVRFRDGAAIAHLGYPDMRVPISYALTYPERAATPVPPLDLRTLEFHEPDTETFRMLALAREAGEKGGTYPCAYNAANEVAVQAFLEGRIGFLDIAAARRGRARARRRRARTRPRRARRGRPPRPRAGGCGMSLTVAILSLAVLIFVHEAGHFFVARAVGMTPRKFYLGFGPPLVKRVRGGVEYGIAAFPLGGYVKIPGMHRPAPGDLRHSLAAAQQNELAPQLDALDAALERDDEATALTVATQLEPQLPGNKMLQELEWALAPDAYWRQRVWKKVAVIAAGPLTNVAFAIVLLVVFFMMGAFNASRIVERVLPGHPAAAAGLRAGDRILSVAGHSVTPNTIATNINATHGRPFTFIVVRNGHRVTIGPLKARLDQGAYRVGFEIKGVPGPGDSFPTACWHAVRVVGVVHLGDCRAASAAPLRTGTAPRTSRARSGSSA